MREIYLKPGEWATVTEPSILKTILGSCVAVALFDSDAQVAGLNHFLLPRAPSHAPESHRGRYGDTAISWLLQSLLHSGADPENLRAKIYGGGAVVRALTGEFRVGELNIEIAREMLAEHGITILDEEVGGTEGRHLTFNTRDFSVKVREIERSG